MYGNYPDGFGSVGQYSDIHESIFGEPSCKCGNELITREEKDSGECDECFDARIEKEKEDEE